ncbi:DUF433 domain-containing protein [Bradyrhizobium sp. BRP23]|uniref:DUF433 domain-containing protein n=1 Tax=Bradyrhizobium sp. BRP23 TaxID=2793820 RepID=UPI001CD71D6F|nr:DUF433 domain-containing protein [Bradyrhizobium sp. BRP23]MCA1419519.1 DUF433 domain-containing protein [Bradyrhizobium sp. BRP23]
MNAHVSLDWRKAGDIGLYTVPMAARILHEDGSHIRSWINGVSHSEAPPIIHRQLPLVGGKTVLGFLDLIEARFIKHFKDLGLSSQTIRKIAERLRSRHRTDHPFATNKAFRTDGKTILMEIAQDDEKKILNLLNDNFEMGPIVEQSLFDTILYADDLAYRWHPSPTEHPRVVLDPNYAFGRPVLEGIWIPTDALAAAFNAEGDTGPVAEDFEIDESDVLEAVAYEGSLKTSSQVENKAG